MKCQFLSQTMLAAAAVTVSAVTAIGEPVSATERRFDCPTINGVVTTVATETQTGESKPLFYWHDDAFLPPKKENGEKMNAQEICQRVSGKLQSNGDDISIQVEKVGGVPVVCLNEKDQAGCGQILFSASSTSNLNRIYPENQGSRGVQRFGQPVRIWELLGF